MIRFFAALMATLTIFFPQVVYAADPFGDYEYERCIYNAYVPTSEAKQEHMNFDLVPATCETTIAAWANATSDQPGTQNAIKLVQFALAQRSIDRVIRVAEVRVAEADPCGVSIGKVGYNPKRTSCK